jgi:hypothetical protein
MTGTELVPPLGLARVNDWIRHHILRGAGMCPVTSAELDAAASAKRCPQFDALRMARLRMGHLRYGMCGRSYYDAILSIIARAEDYARTGNRELLVDIANLAEIEWIMPNHPHPIWDAQDCGGHSSLRGGA